MCNVKPMKIVLIEDDTTACRAFMNYAGTCTDIAFVGMTGSSDTGLEYVKNKLPDAVILDLELNWGQGSGLEFLASFANVDLSVRPIVVVTTRNRSEIVQERLHEYGVEWIFSKQQEGYCPEMVIKHLRTLRPYMHMIKSNSNPKQQTLESPEEVENRLTQRIFAELNAVGISPRLKGRNIVADAIFRLVRKEDGNSESVFRDLSVTHKTHYNNILRNVQSAIQDAWNNTPIETLERHYTAPIRGEYGSPSPTEFIHYYADKLRRSM